MLFGENYGDEVRVLDIGTSRELCGGTHVKRTGVTGLFKIVAESGVAAGIRRLEAVTGENALAYIQERESQLQQVADAVKVQPQEAAARITQILDNVKHLERELGRLKSKLASSQGDDLAGQAREVKGAKVLAICLDDADSKTLREALDKLKNKLKSCVVVLMRIKMEGVSSSQALPRSGDEGEGSELVNFVASKWVAGRRAPDMAQAVELNLIIYPQLWKALPAG